MKPSLQLQAVHPAYRTFLAIHVSITFFVLVAGGLVVFLWTPMFPNLAPTISFYIGMAALLLVWLGSVLIWAPRRYRVTHYYVGDDYIGYVVGAIWHTEVVVTFNRLQHLEIAQGPIERLLGICRLVLYTAGGSSADLMVPGLTMTNAELLRDRVLHDLRQEELSDVPITEAKSNDA